MDMLNLVNELIAHNPKLLKYFYFNLEKYMYEDMQEIEQLIRFTNNFYDSVYSQFRVYDQEEIMSIDPT
jgi:hypothetical protein